VSEVDPAARFAELVARPDGEIPLDEAALLIAASARPDVDVAAELRQLDELAASCPEPTFDGWRRHVFGTLGFAGNREDYYDPANSFLDEVVRRRTGIPISLSVVTAEIGRRLGLRFVGIGMPGHFLLHHEGEPAVFVDSFASGRVLDDEGCRARFHEVHGARARFDPAFLERVGPRDILARMLLNLRAIYSARGDTAALRWVLGLRLALPGTSQTERADLADALGTAGHFSAAASELDTLAAVSDDEKAASYRARAVTWRARLN
jgi:regulator of sirC expression with transglutaminase-like and TPR domain